MLTRADFGKLYPKAKPALLDGIAAAWPSVSARYGLASSQTRASYFLANVGHESLGATVLEENLRYSASRLHAVWPKRFPTVASAKPYASNPSKLANKVYGGRMGNTAPDDGYRYRGRGLMQITGKDGYRKVGEVVGLDLVGRPDLASDPATALLVAAGVWHWKKANAYADRDDVTVDDVSEFVSLTRAINGGTNGLADRRAWLAKVEPIVAEAFRRGGAPTPIAQPDPDPVVVPLPEPRPDPATLPKALVEAVQRELEAHGYHVGLIDGKFGSRTRGAILAFQADNGLPLDGETVTTELLAAIEDAPHRPVSEERAAGEPENSRIIDAADKTTAVGGGAVGLGILTMLSPLLDAVEKGSGMLQRLGAALEPLADVLWLVLPVAVIAGGGAVIYFARRAKKARIEDFRSGRAL
jgi:putative chitinase